MAPNTAQYAGDRESMIGEAIYSLLAADAEVAAIVETRIAPHHLPESASVPCLTWRLDAAEPQTMTRNAGYCQGTLRIACWASTYTAADALAGAVRSALDCYGGSVADTDIYAICHETGADDYEWPDDASDRGLYRVDCNFRLHYQEEVIA
jgi:hypothetical protein